MLQKWNGTQHKLTVFPGSWCSMLSMMWKRRWRRATHMPRRCPSAHQLPHQLRFVGEMLKFVVSGHGILGECRVVHESSRGARQSLQLRILVSCLDTLTPFWSGSLCLDQLISVIIYYIHIGHWHMCQKWISGNALRFQSHWWDKHWWFVPRSWCLVSSWYSLACFGHAEARQSNVWITFPKRFFDIGCGQRVCGDFSDLFCWTCFRKFPRDGITDAPNQIADLKQCLGEWLVFPDFGGCKCQCPEVKDCHSPCRKGHALAYVGDVVGTGSSRKSATNSILWYMGAGPRQSSF